MPLPMPNASGPGNSFSPLKIKQIEILFNNHTQISHQTVHFTHLGMPKIKHSAFFCLLLNAEMYRLKIRVGLPFFKDTKHFFDAVAQLIDWFLLTPQEND
jgi:bacteriorhodopsin